MKNTKLFFLSLIALGMICNAAAQESKEILFSDSFAGTEIGEAWTLQTRPFDYKAYPEAQAVVETLVEDHTVSLDLMASSDYWGGAAYLTRDAFNAAPRKPLTYTIDRDFLGILGTGGRCSILVYEGTGEHWVNFSDSNELGLHHGWGYNRLIDQGGDNPSGAATLLPPLQSDDLLNYGSHTVSVVANGVTLALYVDGILGGEVDFPVTEGIHFGFGVYGETVGDMVFAGFKNVVVSAETLEPGAPVILKEPADLTVMEQTRADFSLEVLDGETFQWFRDGAAIEGATNVTYSIAEVAMEDAGEYSVEISNELGSVTSRSALLTVTPFIPSVVELNYELQDGKLILTFTGFLQESDDCQNWSAKLPITSPYEVPLDARKKFYRATL